jgi:lysophospholipase L1-like esterase
LIVMSACGSDPVTPSPAIMCPAPITVVSASSLVPVTYPPPVAAGGAGVATSCAPASGTTFAAGTTAVSCSAVVAEERVSCSFNVTVAPPPRIEATRLLAFGDSITYGSFGERCPGEGFTGQRTGRAWAEEMQLLRQAVGPEHSYPSVLQTGLRERYAAQLPVVENEGNPGEMVGSSETMRRFVRRLNEQRPEVLLLQEGINDLHNFGFAGLSTSQGVAQVSAALRAMIREAKGRGVQVFLGTLLPERPDACRAFAIPPRGAEDLITPANAQIRSLAVAENVALVDLYAMFEDHVDVLLDRDGIHPTRAGYAVIALSFFRAVQQKLENPPPAAVGLTRPW